MELGLRSARALEIAGPSEFFSNAGPAPIYRHLRNLDDFSYPRPVAWGGRELRDGEDYHAYGCHGRQIVGDATCTTALGDGSYSLLLASHVLEHIANPIKALHSWMRVLEVGGSMLLILPHRDGANDRCRPITSLEHMIGDYERDVLEDDLTHHEEVKALSLAKHDNDWWEDVAVHRGLHHHVFSSLSASSLLEYVGLEVLMVQPVLPYHIVLSARVRDDNSRMTFGSRSSSLSSSPFQTDREDARTIGH